MSLLPHCAVVLPDTHSFRHSSRSLLQKLTSSVTARPRVIFRQAGKYPAAVQNSHPIWVSNAHSWKTGDDFRTLLSINDSDYRAISGRNLTFEFSKRVGLRRLVHLTRSSIVEEQNVKQEYVASIKAVLHSELKDVNRGIFGVQSAKKAKVEGLIKELEALNPLQEPTNHLDQVQGAWRLLYSTISILGPRRTKLGLREFVNLGEFRQIIDTAKSRALTEVKFNVAGMSALSGWLSLEASYTVLSTQRVGIKLERSSIVPAQLMNLFEKNYDLLLSIFNPEGWLDITYVDESIRIGRDEKGNIFLVERIKK